MVRIRSACAAFFARAADQKLTGPGGDAGDLKPGADDEERGDEDDSRIAEAAERLTDRENTGRPQR
jgi:hypothetical protein